MSRSRTSLAGTARRSVSALRAAGGTDPGTPVATVRRRHHPPRLGQLSLTPPGSPAEDGAGAFSSSEPVGVGERFAIVTANLIQVRATAVAEGAGWDWLDVAALEHELSSVQELLRLIARDLGFSAPTAAGGDPTATSGCGRSTSQGAFQIAPQ